MYIVELDKLVLFLEANPSMVVEIGGHTDNTGSRAYNQPLSERRAGAVADYLSTTQVERNRMLVEGVAFDQPIAGNSTAQGRAANRRVELYILPQSS